MDSPYWPTSILVQQGCPTASRPFIEFRDRVSMAAAGRDCDNRFPVTLTVSQWQDRRGEGSTPPRYGQLQRHGWSVACPLSTPYRCPLSMLDSALSADESQYYQVSTRAGCDFMGLQAVITIYHYQRGPIEPSHMKFHFCTDSTGGITLTLDVVTGPFVTTISVGLYLPTLSPVSLRQIDQSFTQIVQQINSISRWIAYAASLSTFIRFVIQLQVQPGFLKYVKFCELLHNFIKIDDFACYRCVQRHRKALSEDY